jgi:hypothetical protein
VFEPDLRSVLGSRLQAVSARKGPQIMEFLHAYTPELYPTEHIWGHLNHHELTNRFASNFADLKLGARNRLHSMQRRLPLICACWHQAELAL